MRGIGVSLLSICALTAALGLAPPPEVGVAATTQGTAATARPNIVFIMVDDMRDDDLRFMPSTRATIRDRGVRFVNSFSPYPLCCPARSSVFSGQYTHNHGVYTVYADYGFHAFDDSRTLATMLDRAGYATTYLGKYLNRYGVDPPHGVSTGNSLRYVPPGWDMWRASL
ncbi:MAG TPA: sulfatase-like hydrolase/transferase, partial [Nocardioides sp.]|nr:sulfatase-like hydrolase/transferase [Nocardioides sp.]